MKGIDCVCVGFYVWVGDVDIWWMCEVWDIFRYSWYGVFFVDD